MKAYRSIRRIRLTAALLAALTASPGIARAAGAPVHLESASAPAPKTTVSAPPESVPVKSAAAPAETPPPARAASVSTEAPQSAQITPNPTPFAIVWFPDTQSSAYGEPEALAAMGKWVSDHAESDNIAYVLQTGDLVDNGFVEAQWKNFELAYDQFAGRVPYFCIAGNHDLGVKRQEWDGYLARPYAHTVPQEQEFMGGKAAYTLFSAGGTDFIVVGVGHGAEEESLRWVRDAFNRHPNRYGILMLHGYLHGRGTFVHETAWTMYDRVVSRCRNIRMTLSAHYRGTAYKPFEIDDNYDAIPDRTVHSFLCNYQNYMRLGGQLRLLIFDPADGSLTVDTFSTLTGHPMRDATMKQAVFTLQNIF